MCLLFFSYRNTPGYRLVVAANRDEYLARPTAGLDFIDKEKTILAGRDLQGGGTWLGITASLRFAAITNYRDPGTTRQNAPSRGEILLSYLSGEMPARDYLQALMPRASEYNGFNLILGDDQELYYYSNKLSGPRLLPPGYYGLSNHLLDTPWPKVLRGKNLLHSAMVETKGVQPLRLIELLADRHQPPDNQLPDTGVGLAWERLLGRIFIEGVNYGTRSSAVISVNDAGGVEFTEKTYILAGGEVTKSQVVCLSLNG